KAVEAELAVFRERVESLRTKYDRYFMGLERIPPEKIRSDLERDLRNSNLEKAPKTAIKFQFNNIRQRMNTYKRYWDRIMRMIEEGRFKREKGALQKMGVAPAAPQDAPQKGGGNANERAVYDSWVKAQKKLGRDSDVDFDRFRAKLDKQRTAQKDKYGWSDVNYSVRVKNGKVALVAKPVSEDSDE
ncbi:MAG: MXAN_5187 C-terminal domain-containing protein, partial [Myxococcota bacterium]|nr:MXAN_5187 C-terminal domain-containing protein [Myxococcota bacterium]